MTRNSEVLANFVAYCMAHPDERFWQALRNWCGWNFVEVTNIATWDRKADQHIDTFYWEGRTFHDAKDAPLDSIR